MTACVSLEPVGATLSPAKIADSPSKLRLLVTLWVASGSLIGLTPVVYWMSLNGSTPIYLAPYSIYLTGVISFVWYICKWIYDKIHPSLVSEATLIKARGPRWAPFAPAAAIGLFIVFALSQPLGRYGFIAPIPHLESLTFSRPVESRLLTATYILMSIVSWWMAQLTLYRQPHLSSLHAGWCAVVSCITCGVLVASTSLQSTHNVSLASVLQLFYSLRWILAAQATAGFLQFAGISTVCACGGPVLCAESKAAGFALAAVILKLLGDTDISKDLFRWRATGAIVILIPVIFPKYFISLATAHHLKLRYAAQKDLLEEGLNRMLTTPGATMRVSPSPVRRYVSRAQDAFGQALNDAVLSPMQSTHDHLRFAKQRSTPSHLQSTREMRYYTHPGISFGTETSEVGNASRGTLFLGHALSLDPGVQTAWPPRCSQSIISRPLTMIHSDVLRHPRTQSVPVNTYVQIPPRP